MRKLLLLVISPILALLLCEAGGNTQTEADHRKWLESKYQEATSIEEGMSRADLLKLFTEDGGLQRVPASRYRLKSCEMIKVEVEFNTEYGVKYKPKPNEKLIIKAVSLPYLQYPVAD